MVLIAVKTAPTGKHASLRVSSTLCSENASLRGRAKSIAVKTAPTNILLFLRVLLIFVLNAFDLDLLLHKPYMDFKALRIICSLSTLSLATLETDLDACCGLYPKATNAAMASLSCCL